jgi:hypothetical protein
LKVSPPGFEADQYDKYSTVFSQWASVALRNGTSTLIDDLDYSLPARYVIAKFELDELQCIDVLSWGTTDVNRAQKM